MTQHRIAKTALTLGARRYRRESQLDQLLFCKLGGLSISLSIYKMGIKLSVLKRVVERVKWNNTREQNLENGKLPRVYELFIPFLFFYNF